MTDKDLIASDREQKPGPARLILTLAIAGLISGTIIVGIYEATFATIAENRARELREAVFTVLPGITRMQEVVYRNGQLIAGEKGEGERSIYAGYDENGDFNGYAIPGEGPGFQDTIGLLYGYKPRQKKVVGMEILESRETPGLGDRIFKDEDFVAEFDDLSVEPSIKLVKDGSDEPNEVDAITGATISSEAVVKIINETNKVWLERLPLEAPSLAATGKDDSNE